MHEPLLVLSLLLLSGPSFSAEKEESAVSRTKHPFTVANDIEFTFIGQGYSDGTVQFSPNGEYFAVLAARERIDLNSPEDALRFFRAAD